MLIHKDLVGTTDAIDIPQVDTTYGAGFGDSITDADRAFAACREPVAHFLTYGVANDITDKWFIINDPDTEEADPALDRTVQDVLTELKFKKYFTDAISQARIYKKAIIVCAFNDAKTVNELRTPLKPGAELVQLAVYPKTVDCYKLNDYTIESKDENVNSPRYGEPVIYKVDRGNGNYLFVHYTRVLEVDNEQSILDAVWDDMGCGRNIRWGAAQWLYRTGSGFPVFKFPAGTTAEQLEAYHNSGVANNLMSRTSLLIAQNSTTENTGMDFEFKGPAGQSLDPTPFFQTNLEQISIATGIPQAKLRGAQAGAVTGSEVNMQDYYKVVSREQQKFEDCIRWLLDKLADSGQVKLIKSSMPQAVTVDGEIKKLKALLRHYIKHDYRHKSVGKYVVEWNSAFELSEKDEAQIEESHVRANQGKLDYMSKDEVRAEEGLDPLPDKAGEWKEQPTGLQLFNDPEEKKEQSSEEGNQQEQLKQADKFLLIDLKPKPKVHQHAVNNTGSSSTANPSK